MRKVNQISEGWHFVKGMDEVPTAVPETAEAVSLPHTWNGIDGQDGGNDYFRGTCCYLKSLTKNEFPAADHYYLEIRGANSSAEVYLNGKKLAQHDGGYSTWRVELTKELQEENLLAVLVDNSPNETVYPQTADFTFYGGLYRDVNVIAVNDTHFDLETYGGTGLWITPVVAENDALVSVKADIVNLQAGDQIRYEITDAAGDLVIDQVGFESECVLKIAKVHLWDGVKDPYLYTMKAAVLRDGVELDTVTARFGCRSFSIDPERGFILNGREYPLRGVSRHQDRLGLGNALLPEHHREDMDLICEMGANTIRLAHYQHDQYFYDLCDECGMVVWAEIPYISRHMPTGNANVFSQMKELITQNYNHASIVVWGLSNEITMGGAKDPDLLRTHRELNEMVHRMDATRPTVMACISMCNMDEEYVRIPDVVSYNHYFGWYGGDTSMNGPWFDKFHEKYPGTPIGVSEYGCEALNWHTSNPTQGDYTEEYQAYYHEELIKQLYTRPYIWATHVWNMFDFGADARAEGGENGQNHKGLITMDRKYKKDSFYAYKAWLSDEPFVHLCGKRYVDRVEEVTKVTVYSNLPEVELFVNGVSLEKKQSPEHFFYFEVPNVGESTLVAVAGECRDESVIRKVETRNEDYVLKEQGAVLNWFDIEAIEGRFCLNDKIGDIMGTLRGKLWFGGMLLALAKKQKAAKKTGKGAERKAETAEDKKKKSSGFGMSTKAMFGMIGSMMQMVGGFTVLRLTGMVGMVNISFTKEELLKMNRKLNKIRKPKKG